MKSFGAIGGEALKSKDVQATSTLQVLGFPVL
jgi:hypothetical protein